jgi:hypothetical protein
VESCKPVVQTEFSSLLIFTLRHLAKVGLTQRQKVSDDLTKCLGMCLLRAARPGNINTRYV